MTSSRAVLLLAAVLFLWNLWAFDLWAPDEPYFGEGAREMVVDGKWAVPHVNGEMTTDKPPLFFWLIALVSLPLGQVTSFTARLPSALLTLASLALVMRLGRRMSNRRVGALAGLVLATAWMPFDKARSAQIDATLCFLILVALSAFEAWRSGDADGRRTGLLFWTAAALAVLAKGPVGFLLPLGVALVTLVSDRRLRSWGRFAPLLGPSVFLLIIAAWMTLATLGGGGDYSVWGAFREHVVDRAVHGMHHAQPFWYYAKVLPLHFMPWAGLVPGAVVLAWRRRTPADRFLLVWAVFILLFFSVTTEKRDLYILPAFPALALLVALLIGAVCGWEGDSVRDLVNRRWVTIGTGIPAAMAVIVGLALPIVARGRGGVPVWIGAVLGALLALTGVVVLVASLRGRARGAVYSNAVGIALAYLAVTTFLLPALNPVKSSRPFALRVLAATTASRQAGHVVPSYRLSNLPEAFSFHTNGIYFPEIEDPGRLAEHLDQTARVFALVDRDQLHLLPGAVRERLNIVEEARLSRKNVALVRNGGPPASDLP